MMLVLCSILFVFSILYSYCHDVRTVLTIKIISTLLSLFDTLTPSLLKVGAACTHFTVNQPFYEGR